MAVAEFERGIAFLELVPELPDAKTLLLLVRVVEQHHGLARKFRQPRLEIVPNRLIAVEAVDVQQVDGAVLEFLDRLIESLAQQLREAPEAGVVESLEAFIDVLAILSGLRIALPRVDRKAARKRAGLADGLTECRVRNAGVRAEFYDQQRTGLGDEPVREGHVPRPGRERIEPRDRPEHPVERRVGEYFLRTRGHLSPSAGSCPSGSGFNPIPQKWQAGTTRGAPAMPRWHWHEPLSGLADGG